MESGAVGAFIILVFTVTLYLLPAVIAGARKHESAGAIAVVNLFFGWTFLGWIACLVWAFVDNKPVVQYQPKTTSVCSKCGTANPLSNKKCISCGKRLK